MHSERSSQFRWLITSYGLFILLMIFLAFLWRMHSIQHPFISHHEVLHPMPQDSQIDAAHTVQVGLLVDNIYNFEADKKTFDADGWVWLKWTGEIDKQMKAQGVSPDELFFFFNQVEGWDSALTPGTENPQQMADGRYYQKFRFSGHFYANELDFRKYPFQTIKLPMVLELKPQKLMVGHQGLHLTLDEESSGLGAYIDMGGYITSGYTFGRYFHQYGSTLGEPDLTKAQMQLPQARLEIAYQKAPVATILKLLLPLVTVMALTLFSPSISSIGWDVRVGIPPTALLTLIFLQQTYQNWLPELPYITFLDTVYNICYFVNLLLFGLFLWGTNEYSSSEEHEKVAVVAHIDRVDRYFQVVILIMLVVGIAINWFALNRPVV